MRAILFLVVGMATALAQAELWSVSPYLPDLRLMMLVFLITRISRPRLTWRLLGYVLGCSAGSQDLLGLWCVGTGLSAMLLLRIRPLVFVHNPVVQIFASAVTVGVFGAVRVGIEVLGLAPASPRDAASWVALAGTVLLAPVLHRIIIVVSRILPGRGVPRVPAENLVHRPRARMP